MHGFLSRRLDRCIFLCADCSEIYDFDYFLRGSLNRHTRKEISLPSVQYDTERISRLSTKLSEGLLSMEHTSLNGDPSRHYPGCVNVSFAYVEGESLLMALKDIALSSGSACTSASLEPSYVLRALGNSDESAHSSIRFGIGRYTTEAEVDYVLQAVSQRVQFLRELSPLWELVQEGVDLNTIEWSQH